MQKRILIVDDESDIRRNIIKGLGEERYEFIECIDETEMREALKNHDLDVMILDLRIPNVRGEFLYYTGLKLLEYTKEVAPHIQVIIFTGVVYEPHREDAYKLGAHTVFDKEVKPSILSKRIREAIKEKERLLKMSKSSDSSTLTTQTKIDVTILRTLIDEAFNEGELRDLCFNLNIDYGTLPGNSKSSRVRELILYHQRRNTMSELINALKRIRPNQDWQ